MLLQQYLLSCRRYNHLSFLPTNLLYVLSSPDIDHIELSACYAMSGVDIGLAAYMCYALCGPDIGSALTFQPRRLARRKEAEGRRKRRGCSVGGQADRKPGSLFAPLDPTHVRGDFEVFALSATSTGVLFLK
eukprot:2090812-Rhodomonas_salina.4